MAVPARTGLRQAVLRLRESAQDLHAQIRADFAPMASLDLHTFTTPDAVTRFQVTTDRVLGGRTQASFSLREYQHFTAGRFEGAIDFSDDNPSTRGGFAAVRTLPDERVRDLAAFEAFEMRIKTDGRPYIANFKCADHAADQLWQIRLVTDPFRWTTVCVPFRDLMLTKRGRVEVHQFEINRETVNGFGVLLADGRNGPFRFEIQYLRALRQFIPEHYQSVPERVIEERAQAESAKLEAGKTAAQRQRDAALEAFRQQREAAKVE